MKTLTIELQVTKEGFDMCLLLNEKEFATYLNGYSDFESDAREAVGFYAEKYEWVCDKDEVKEFISNEDNLQKFILNNLQHFKPTRS
jgi:hypothetical protein